MKPNPFRTPSRAGSHLRFLRIPPERRVILCCSPQQFVTLELHCSEHGSTLCLGELYCDVRENGVHCTRLYAYAPALTLMNAGGRWERCILPVGDPWGIVAERDLRGMDCLLGKTQRRDGTESSLNVKSSKPVEQAVLDKIGATWFDIRPRLLARYGVSVPVEEMLPPGLEDPKHNPEFDSDLAGAILSFKEAQARAGKAG